MPYIIPPLQRFKFLKHKEEKVEKGEEMGGEEGEDTEEDDSAPT